MSDGLLGRLGLPCLPGVQQIRTINHPQVGEDLEFIGNSLRAHGRVGVSHLKVEVRRVGVTRVPYQGEYLPCLNVFADLDSQTAWLKVGIEGAPSVAQVEDHIVTDDIVQGNGTALPLGKADVIGKIVDLQTPCPYQVRVLHPVMETLSGCGHFARLTLYNRAPMRGVADL
jgi:hypothetical protein